MENTPATSPKNDASVKARVERVSVVKARVASTGALTAQLRAAHPPKNRVHRGKPLFVLTTARRRRAGYGSKRGGYYALSASRKTKGLPLPFRVALWSFGSLFATTLSFLILVGAGLYGGYLWIARDLPSVDNIHSIQFETTHIYDRNGRLLYEMYDPGAGKRNYVTIDQMPRYMTEATIAVEDSSFEQNNGVDLRAIARAVYINFTNKGSSGASTITQQLVRNVILPEHNEPTFTRKIREAILATEVTQKYSKDKILEIYLNEIYYGSLSYGVDAAANTYFGKRVKDLSLAQCALLAGLPQLPGQYDPNHNFELAKARQRIVLDLMAKNNYITRAQADAAFAEDVHPVQRTANVPQSAPHFVQYVQETLEQKYGVDMAYRGGLKVFTTIDLDMQAEAQRIAAQQIDAIKRQGASNAALVAINPRTGEILAMVGSVDFTNPIFGEVNVATSLRQPGSSFKPFTYATALQRGDWTPDSILPDLPAKFTNGANLLPYVPQNYDGRFHGPVTMRAALANSYNIPAVQMLKEVGVPAVLDTVHKMGITTLNDPSRYGLALTLGGGEVTLLDMTAAYSVFANYGYRVPATPFLKVTDAQGKVLEELNLNHPRGKQVLNSGVTYQISNMLSDNAARSPAFGPNSPLKIDGINAAVKTGTTNDWKDSWTMGYTPALAVGVWVGNNDGRAMAHVAGAIGAAPIWHNFIVKVYGDPKLKARLLRPHEGSIPEAFQVPPGMVRAAVCAVSGMAPTAACKDLKWDWFTQDNLPKDSCDWHQWVAVTLHDGGATRAGPGVPKSDTIERIFTFPPSQFKGWVGGGPPISVTTAITTAAVALPTRVRSEPPSIAGLITPVPALVNDTNVRPAGLQQPGSLEPIAGLQLAFLSPTDNAVVTGTTQIFGRANADNFAHYHLEYGPEPGVDMKELLTSETAVPQGILGEWDTTGLAPGRYLLRMTMETYTGEAARTEIVVQVGYASPTVAIVSPADNSAVFNGEAVDVQVQADGSGAPLAGVEIYADGRRIASLTTPPWSARWTVITGTHEFVAIAYTAPGEQVRSVPVRVFSVGLRPTPTATVAPIIWISNLTEYKEIKPGVNEVWTDVQPNSAVQHVDIYIDGFPAGYATGPGFRVNPLWTPTPGPPPTQTPAATLEPDAASTATAVQATVGTQATRAAVVSATRVARARATSTARAAAAQAATQNAAKTATVAAATASPTPAPATQTPRPSATPTFVRYSKLPDPMLGDYIARCIFTPGRHRVTAIGYDASNNEVGRDETWVVVR